MRSHVDLAAQCDPSLHFCVICTCAFLLLLMHATLVGVDLLAPSTFRLNAASFRRKRAFRPPVHVVWVGLRVPTEESGSGAVCCL
jgi:hypothetical protein